MSDTAQLINTVIGLVMMGGLALVYWLVVEESHKRLDDPDDDRTVWLDQLPNKVALAPHGTYRVTVLRQSGNVHAERVVTGTAQDALKVALATFRRARVQAVHVGRNLPHELSFGRMYHDHRGKSEGKKIGRAVIAVLAEAGPPAPPTPEAPHAALASRPGVEVRVDMTCDCGHMASLAEDELAEANDCPACGRTNTHTPEEIARVKVELARLREETKARLDAGIPAERIVADHRKRDG